MSDYILSIIEKELGAYRWAGNRNVVCKCPFHKGGKERKPSFSINVDTGAWTCYSGCGGGGLRYLLLELGHPRAVVDRMLAPIQHLLGKPKRRTRGRRSAGDPFMGKYFLPEELLRLYDYEPKDLVRAGFDPDLLEDVGAGVDKKRNRVVWPLRDTYGNLIGLSGRLTDEDAERYDVGKYKVYSQEIQALYEDYEKPGHNFLWNLDRLYQELTTSEEREVLIVTEGFKACLWCVQHGWRKTVALMTTSLSDEQRSLIEQVCATVVLFLDNDEPGILGTLKAGAKLRESGLEVWVAEYPEDIHQPDDMSPEQLDRALTTTIPFNQWRRKAPPHLRQKAAKTKKRRQ